MPVIIGVKFRDSGKVYYFDPDGQEMRYHDHVIVETSRGMEYGTVVITPTEIAEDKIPGELKKIVRPATEEDDAHEKENREKESAALKLCKEKVREHGLEMKLIGAEYTFDNSKIYFYFTADGRIDFRELVKDLVGVFRTRIELRQIGVRDETKILGGIGSCGRTLCCHTWLNEFAPVSIKMAKDQNLSLNPTKISGCCGRLMCCLKNEADTYAELNKGLPNKGDYVTTPDGLHGDVHSVNILRQTVKVIVELENDEKELQEFAVSDITFIPKSKKPKKDVKKAEDDAAERDASGKNTDESKPRERKQPKDKSQSEERKQQKDKNQSEERKQQKDKKESGERKQQKDKNRPEDKKQNASKGQSGEKKQSKERKQPKEQGAPKEQLSEKEQGQPNTQKDPDEQKRRRRRRKHRSGSNKNAASPEAGGNAPEKQTEHAKAQG